jgi:hypothetical protein
LNADFNDLFARARAANNTGEAVQLLRAAMSMVTVQDTDFARCCRELCDLYLLPAHKRPLAAAALKEYLRDLEAAGALYAQVGSVRDVARIQTLRRNFRAAVDAYAKVNMLAHAAEAAEMGQMHDLARDLWGQLIRPADLQGNTYVGALARFNCGRAAKAQRDTAAANAWFFEAMNMLGQEADHRETKADRDGAVRCFLIMAAIGRSAHAFEDIAEGYLNVARLMRAKGDRFGTIRALHELIQTALDQGELHAAAELFREAGEYARRVGFRYADYFLFNAGHVWKRVATESLEARRPVGLVENALLAAVDAFNRSLDHGSVVHCYQALAALDLGPARRERYQKLASELGQIAKTAESTAGGDRAPSLPEYIKRPFTPVPYWTRELLDREASADINVAASRLLADSSAIEIWRRRALNLFLAFDEHVRDHGPGTPLPPTLIKALGESQHVAFIPPLLDSFRRGGEEEKRQATLAAGKSQLREAFAIVDLALSHIRGSPVFDAGVKAIRGMTFPAAVDSLVRIFGHHDAAEVKDVTLRNLALVGTSEACEFLLDVMRSNNAGLGVRARELLLEHAGPKMQAALESNGRGEPDPGMRQFIASLLSRVRARQEAGLG